MSEGAYFRHVRRKLVDMIWVILPSARPCVGLDVEPHDETDRSWLGAVVADMPLSGAADGGVWKRGWGKRAGGVRGVNMVVPLPFYQSPVQVRRGREMRHSPQSKRI